jgi:hypothetical protein
MKPLITLASTPALAIFTISRTPGENCNRETSTEIGAFKEPGSGWAAGILLAEPVHSAPQTTHIVNLIRIGQQLEVAVSHASTPR